MKANISLASLGEWFSTTARSYPHSSAIRFQARTLTFQDLEQLTNRVAGFLRQAGIRKGDRIGLYCPNSDAFVIAYLGIVKAGAVVVPLNVLLNPKEIQFILNDAEAVGLFYNAAFGQSVSEILPGLPQLKLPICIGAPNTWAHTDFEDMLRCTSFAASELHFEVTEDLAAILYTSGTTGRPKGAMLTHANIASNVLSIHQALGFRPDEDRVLVVLPMFHAFAATAAMLAPLLAGCCIVPLPRFDPETTAHAISTEHITIFMGVPSMYTLLLRLPEEFTGLLRSLRFAISGGAALPVEVMRKFEDRYGVLIYEGDGPTECSPVTCVNPIGGKRKPGSVGLPVPMVQMKILDDEGRELPKGQVGEICVRGPNVMKGYWRLPEETRAAFFGEWFRTGDLGYEDDEGYFYIVDRKKDMIIVNGMNVYPRMVEEVLYRHPAIREAAVVGEPHELHGEIPVAFISLQPNQTVTEQELRQFCLQHLGRHEVPRRFEFLPDLPKNAAGKIMKRALRKTGEHERGVKL